MKRCCLLITGLVLVSPIANAVVLSDADMIGIYFDLTADSPAYWCPANTTVQAYVILTNPSVETLLGYEFGYEIRGNHHLLHTELSGDRLIDIGGESGNSIVVLGSPLTTSEATILCSLHLTVVDRDPIYFTLRSASPSTIEDSPLPAVLRTDEVSMPVGLVAGFDGRGDPAPCAVINPVPVADCLWVEDCRWPMDTEPITWESVKSLYR